MDQTRRVGWGVLCCCALLVGRADAQLTYSLSWGWSGDARQNAANAALSGALARYNAYGDFTGGNGSHVQAAYNAGVPTAQAGYGGWGGIIEYGGTWPNERVTMHELDHWLGTGTFSASNGRSWDGPRAVRILEQFEGVGARVGTDGTHFWPYGLNYDTEWSELNAQRNVALVYALRADWGIGSAANPTAWNATNVTLTGSDAPGTSGFHHADKWSDNTFAHPNADYATGGFDLRTPNGTPSWTFAGKSLTINRGGRLLYNGWGATGRVTINDLTVANATVRHDQFSQDIFRLAGNTTLVGAATFEAARGPMVIEASLRGDGSLTKTGANDLTLAAANEYAGATNIQSGTLRLSRGSLLAEYTFDNVRGVGVPNSGSAGNPLNGLLAGGATIVDAGGGREGRAVSLSGGASVDVQSAITDLAPDGNWAVSAWVNTTTAGGAILSKTDGGWDRGNTAFYLGDGAGAGSGGQPAGVRWAGGFLQTAPGSTTVTDGQWHQVTYVNSGGEYTIYVDGQAQTTSTADSAFGNADVGSLVQLGRANNPGDGALNFNGLMDSVQIFSQSLSAQQVAALHGGEQLGSLPSTTVVNISAAATLDLNGTTQEIAGLNGVGTSAITLGSRGRLIINNAETSEHWGTISGNGGLAKSGAGDLLLAGVGTHTGGITVAEGRLIVEGDTGFGTTAIEAGASLAGSGNVRGTLDLQSGAELEVALAGPSHDPLNVDGAAALDGLLSVSLDAGYLPALGESITVLTAVGLTNNLTLGGPDGALFSLAESTPNALVLTAVSNLAGDYNNDGAVDAADYVVWRDNVGQPAGTLFNDPSAAAVGSAQYAAWQGNYGATMTVVGAAAVPEPAAFALLASVLATLGRVRPISRRNLGG
ncbi:Autotransporter-associated beta strand repeat protein [Posidoniimonas polymericola]|uniref:Autotransporter-associated beta strand repeat protein n=1 Tax=Posidoniimonas polymericola TaxID=2528002 RepID=A0A5C5YL69_9BACT|nr:LamG domain-containing protein [Posidoniimonas polymericola]TWT75594.1 Autotransporter-associated beta strand repeat protein [Posidoniimonas polymericola]